jgi:hypothetical protein
MARKRGRARTSTKIVRVGGAKPIVIRTPAPVHVKKHRGGRRRGGHGALSAQTMMAFGIGGAVAGFADKQFGDKLPTIPLIGRKGVLAIALFFVAKNVHSPIVRDAALASAAISGYELGFSGHISGHMDGVASQV